MNRLCFRLRTVERATNERGLYLPLFAILILAFIALLGLAVDVGQLYRAKLRIQRAVDAGALAGSRLIGTDSGAQAKPISEEAAQDNLAVMDSDLATIEPSAEVLGATLRVRGEIDLPLLILNVVPGLPEISTVSSSAIAANQRAVVMVIADLSGSMDECSIKTADKIPARGVAYCTNQCDGDCTRFCSNETANFNGCVSSCQSRCASAANDYSYCIDRYCEWHGERKIDYLRTALDRFVGDFREGEDYVGIIGFNRRAFTIQDMRPLDLWDVRGKISQIGRSANNGSLYNAAWQTRGGTNHDHGFRLARNALEKMRRTQPAAYSSGNKIVVFITDGAPTASCADDRDSEHCNAIAPPDSQGDCCSPELAHYDRSIFQSDQMRLSLEVPVHSVGIGFLAGPEQTTGPFTQYHQWELKDVYQRKSNGTIDDYGLKSNLLRRIALADNLLDRYLGTTAVFDAAGMFLGYGVAVPNGGHSFSGSSYLNSTLSLGGTTYQLKRGEEFARDYLAAKGQAAPRGEYQVTTDGRNLDAILQRIGLRIRGRLVD